MIELSYLDRELLGFFEILKHQEEPTERQIRILSGNLVLRIRKLTITTCLSSLKRKSKTSCFYKIGLALGPWIQAESTGLGQRVG